jgi:hypothetical protein
LTSQAVTLSQTSRLLQCKRPSTYFSGLALFGNASAYAASGITTKGDWRLFEDREGKPGWISTVFGSTITFPVTFGPNPRLMITYLRSYEVHRSPTSGCPRFIDHLLSIMRCLEYTYLRSYEVLRTSVSNRTRFRELLPSVIRREKYTYLQNSYLRSYKVLRTPTSDDKRFRELLPAI